MPNYNTQNPPYSIFPGDVALAFNSEAPAAGQASQRFALPSYAGHADNSRTIRWQTIFGTAPQQSASFCNQPSSTPTRNTPPSTPRRSPPAKPAVSPPSAPISSAPKSPPSPAAQASQSNSWANFSYRRKRSPCARP